MWKGPSDGMSDRCCLTSSWIARGKKSKNGECRKIREWKIQCSFEDLTCPYFLGHYLDASRTASQACYQVHCSREYHWTWACHPKGPGIMAESATQTQDLQVTAVVQYRSVDGTCWCGLDCSFCLESSLWQPLIFFLGFFSFFFFLTGWDFNCIPLVSHDSYLPNPVQLLCLRLA